MLRNVIFVHVHVHVKRGFLVRVFLLFLFMFCVYVFCFYFCSPLPSSPSTLFKGVYRILPLSGTPTQLKYGAGLYSDMSLLQAVSKKESEKQRRAYN